MRVHLHIQAVLAIPAVLSLFSCTREPAMDAAAAGSENGIIYSIGVTESRAAVNTVSGLKTSGSFKIDGFLESAGRPSGYSGAQHYISDESVTWDSSSHKWKSSCYWISGVYTNFWSRFPLDAPALTFQGNGGTDYQQKNCSFTYTMPSGSGITDYAESKCRELIYAYSRKVTDLTVPSPSLSLKVNFRPVLAAICFDGTLADGIDIQKVSIKGIHTSGDCSLSGVPSVSGDNEGDSFTASWSVKGDRNTVELTQTVTKAELAANVMTTSGAKHFSLIPQTLTSDAKVIVTFVDSSSNTFDATAPLGPVTWEPGSKYTYTIEYSGSQMSIQLTSESVDGWKIVDDGTLEPEKE